MEGDSVRGPRDAYWLFLFILLIGVILIIMAILLQTGTWQGNWTIHDAWNPFLTGSFFIIFAMVMIYENSKRPDLVSKLLDKSLLLYFMGSIAVVMGIGGFLITDPLSIVNVNNAIQFIALGFGFIVFVVIARFIKKGLGKNP